MANSLSILMDISNSFLPYPCHRYKVCNLMRDIFHIWHLFCRVHIFPRVGADIYQTGDSKTCHLVYWPFRSFYPSEMGTLDIYSLAHFGFKCDLFVYYRFSLVVCSVNVIFEAWSADRCGVFVWVVGAWHPFALGVFTLGMGWCIWPHPS